MLCSQREPSAGSGRNSGGHGWLQPLGGTLIDVVSGSQLTGEEVPTRASFGMEVEDDDFLGLVRSSFPFGLVYSTDRGLNEDGMTA